VVYVAGEVVGAEVAVGGGLGEYVPDDHDHGVGGGGGGFLASLSCRTGGGTGGTGSRGRCWCGRRTRRTR
jgi:hypothetical protein